MKLQGEAPCSTRWLGTCKLHDINPFEWMKAVLEKISAHPINKIRELLPHRWTSIL